jgi:hypothetical protein
MGMSSSPRASNLQVSVIQARSQDRALETSERRFVVVHAGSDAVEPRFVPLAIYTYLFDDDHSETMAALEAMSRPAAPNVVPMRRRG